MVDRALAWLDQSLATMMQFLHVQEILVRVLRHALWGREDIFAHNLARYKSKLQFSHQICSTRTAGIPLCRICRRRPMSNCQSDAGLHAPPALMLLATVLDFSENSSDRQYTLTYRNRHTNLAEALNLCWIP